MFPRALMCRCHSWCKMTSFVYRAKDQSKACTVQLARLYSADATAQVDRTYDPKIQSIVEQIGGLSLLEVADLNTLLKKTLNIPDAPMMMAGAMPAGALKDEAEEDDEAETKTVQSLFAVKLTKYDEKRKVALIKEIKKLVPGLNLVQAKKFVEAAPNNVRSDIGKEEAEGLKTALEAVGAEVTIE